MSGGAPGLVYWKALGRLGGGGGTHVLTANVRQTCGHSPNSSARV